MKQIIFYVVIGLIIGVLISIFLQASTGNAPGAEMVNQLSVVEDFLSFATQENGPPCTDGRGVDYFFEEKNLPTPGTNSRAEIINLVPLVAIQAQRCSEFRYGIYQRGHLQKVSREEFNQFVGAYPESETNRLLVEKTGFPYGNKIFAVKTGKLYCYAGSGDLDYCAE